PFRLAALLWRRLWAWGFRVAGLDVTDRADEMPPQSPEGLDVVRPEGWKAAHRGLSTTRTGIGGVLDRD
ncbi:hypothetical protein, partial [Streptomyces sp. NPDC001054]